jgi:hypothetical protein
MKIRQMGAELFRADGRTEMTKVIVAFRNSANAPKANKLTLYREIIAVCSQIHTKHTNTVVWAERGVL